MTENPHKHECHKTILSSTFTVMKNITHISPFISNMQSKTYIYIYINLILHLLLNYSFLWLGVLFLRDQSYFPLETMFLKAHSSFVKQSWNILTSRAMLCNIDCMLIHFTFIDIAYLRYWLFFSHMNKFNRLFIRNLPLEILTTTIHFPFLPTYI